MATEIKTIKCPQCGSVKVQELRTGYYRCESCGSEFFLDSNDINININNGNSFGAGSNAPQLRKYSWIGFGVVFLVVLIPILINLFSSSNSGGSSSGSSSFEWDYSASIAYFESAANQTLIVAIGTKAESYGNADKNKNLIAGFYDAATGKEIKKQALSFSTTDNRINFKLLTNGDLYCIVDKQRLLKIDRQALRVDEVSPDAYKDIPELAAGIAQIEPCYDYYNNGFKIITNDGKSVYYYPLVQKAYADNQLDAFPVGVPTEPAFEFNTNIDEIDIEKSQLMTFKYPAGGYPPVGYPRNYNNEVDFTPGRFYYDFMTCHVLANNEQAVLIEYNAVPGDKQPHFLQALDVNTAKVLWTTQLADNNAYYRGGLISSSGYCAYNGNNGIFFDKNGKIIKQFDLTKL